MLPSRNSHIDACERILAGSIMTVADDLRALDPTDLVAWLRYQRYGNIGALIDTSLEMMFKAGAFTCARSGCAEVGWSGTLRIHIDLEFRHGVVDCHFRLHMERYWVGVSITYMSIDGSVCQSAEQVGRFEAMLRDARIVAGKDASRS